MEYEKNSELLKAMGHPVRLKIIENLMRNECNVKEVMSILGIPQATVSQHLGILKNRGIVVARKEGVRTCYSIVEEKVRDILDILKR
ncbi:winged helix-turn-helix transcriptional regulator [Candidatus Sumerlaeota bacterium]|nr:winged helix-turn-helix transcriptional regulator [Candidatus Sumerlaeota bacterium]